MTDDPLKIRAEEPTTRARRRTARQRPQRLPWIVGSCATLAVVVGWALFHYGSAPDAAQPGKAEVAARAESPDEAEPTVAASDGAAASKLRTEEIVADDGKRLWASPTVGEPIGLEFLPDGVQALVRIRLAELAQHDEGPKIFAALGPWGAGAMASVREATATRPEEVEALTVAPVVLADGQLDLVFRVDLLRPWTLLQLRERFPTGRDADLQGQQVRRVGPRSCWLPAAREGRTLVVCPDELLEPLLLGGGAQPAVVRDIERLLDRSDQQRTALLLVAPKFLESGGVHLLAGPGEPLRDVLDWATDRGATAILASAHLADDLFVEVRATPQLQIPPRSFALMLGDRVAQSSNQVEDLVLAETWLPYGRKVVARFPSMLRVLSRYTRVAEEDGMAVLRCYLPAVAAHNLLTAAELMLACPTGAPSTAATGDPAVGPATDDGIETRLARRSSLVFTKDTLEAALAMLAQDMGVPIEIRGRDLQLDGITKNQSLAIALRDRPAREILLEILLRANPDRTAAGPADSRQKLVYLLDPAGAAARRIVVTTRSAAAQRGEELPSVFRQQGP